VLEKWYDIGVSTNPDYVYKLARVAFLIRMGNPIQRLSGFDKVNNLTERYSALQLRLAVLIVDPKVSQGASIFADFSLPPSLERQPVDRVQQ
jgi:hypothetical protein